LFESTDESVSAVIREGRLSRCPAELVRGTGESVTVIAFPMGRSQHVVLRPRIRERCGLSARELQMADAHPAGTPTFEVTLNIGSTFNSDIG
jgi:hypothetical protein